ncbi:MAG TPA: nucleotidyltransferase domain-containing protein [Oscillatoriaceae cyanobacterium M33_DOE_052]|uniref:Nucleotidyltransferase domain-containing protein n=1 Tax=Planktothricoides sp. SpSt-374 TaxID=2282167 RepID=A0A7C3VFS9_9CYAN|nr:nucleotidyltransferase domain-containing protein [Oscillatoriaceae cyanobacterium M33_DOE_052]
MDQKIEEIVKKTSQEIKNIYGNQLDRIILFGSQARGDARPDSDIDVLIVLKNSFNYFQESQRISEPIAELCLEYNVLISCAFATLQKYQEYDSGFFRNIRREGVII